MLASIFILGGVDALRHPQAKVPLAEPVIDLVTEVAAPVVEKVAVGAATAVEAASDRLGSATADTPVGHTAAADGAAAAMHDAERSLHDVADSSSLGLENTTYIKINAAVQVGAGLLLATGRMPRLASTALAASLVPTTLAGHRFWEAEGQDRQVQQVQFAKNVGLLGGLILAAVDKEGAPSLGWRFRHRSAVRHHPVKAVGARVPSR